MEVKVDKKHITLGLKNSFWTGEGCIELAHNGDNVLLNLSRFWCRVVAAFRCPKGPGPLSLLSLLSPPLQRFWSIISNCSKEKRERKL